MYPATYAKITPDKPAVIMSGSGAKVTYAELDERSNRLAQLLRKSGLRPGDGIALLMENHLRFLEVTWAAQRSGLYYTPISSRLTAEEVAYILDDCGAKAFITTAGCAPVATDAARIAANLDVRLAADGLVEGFESYEEATATQPPSPLPDEMEGADLLYSSGTTGRPKGVRLPLLQGREIGSPDGVTMLMGALYGAGADCVYLSPAPLYHAAPLRFCMAVHRLGGTVVAMEHFEPIEYLGLIERYRVTHTQLVPTMFVRMLKLPAEVRDRFDLSSLRCAVHAAAPCPVQVKQEMIHWWGPIIHEYYAGTEGNGFCAVGSQEWLLHPGTVGKPLVGTAHILDEAGQEVPAGVDGMIYFGDGAQFEYLNDPDKTAASRDPNGRGWTTLGDIGHLDEEGYLYLTDRKSYMIISGGVNIYPQEAENVLIAHPKVMDVAVFGVPNADLGEEVKAVVQPVDMAEASPFLEEELISYCKGHLASYKCPRSIDFESDLPRHPTGKLYKRLLRDRYWQGHESRIL